MTENNAAQAAESLLDYAMAIAHERELDVTGHKHDSDGAVRHFKAAVERALLSKLRAPVADDLVHRLRGQYAMGPMINGEPEFGWRDCSGPAPEGMRLPSPIMLEAAAAIERLHGALASAPATCGHQFHFFGDQKERRCNRCGVIESKASAPVADGSAFSAALRAIAEYPTPGEGNMSAAGMREIARAALAGEKVAGKCPPPPTPPQPLAYREVESGVVKPRPKSTASAPVAGKANAALNEWFDKTDFIQKRISSGDLPVKYLGWHRADVMRDLIDAAARNQVLPPGCIVVQEADTIPHTHPEYGSGIFFTEDARIEFDAAPQASEAMRILFPAHLRKMWSGGEVQAWLDEHQGIKPPKASAKGSLDRYRKWQAERDAAFSAGIMAAADLVKKLVDGYDTDHGSTDPETGTREYPGEGATWVCEMQELEESIRALSAQPGAQKGGSDGDQ